jgi:hypothetical protein
LPSILRRGRWLGLDITLKAARLKNVAVAEVIIV